MILVIVEISACQYLDEADGAMMTTHFLGDTAVLTGRTLRHITRSPDTIITTAT